MKFDLGPRRIGGKLRIHGPNPNIYISIKSMVHLVGGKNWSIVFIRRERKGRP